MARRKPASLVYPPKKTHKSHDHRAKKKLSSHDGPTDDIEVKSEQSHSVGSEPARTSKKKAVDQNASDSDSFGTDERVDRTNRRTGKGTSRLITDKSNQPLTNRNDAPSHSLSLNSRPNIPPISEFSDQLSRLLAQESFSLHVPSPKPISQAADCSTRPNDLDGSLKDKRLAYLEKELTAYKQLHLQMRDDLDLKDKLFSELVYARHTDPELALAEHRLKAEAHLTATQKLVEAQKDEILESRQIIKDLHAKINRILSGEEERLRRDLEEEKQELLEINTQLRSAYEAQRRKRKDTEKELKQVRSILEDERRNEIRELESELKTMKKMLAAETENSKALIAQLNQIRAAGASSSQRGVGIASNPSNTGYGRSEANLHDLIEEYKVRTRLIGDFTGLQILSKAHDKKGAIYDCMYTDLAGHGYALSFKLQSHEDGTYSYFPALDESRDAETIQVLPAYLRSFVRFGIAGQAHLFRELFKAFNLQQS